MSTKQMINKKESGPIRTFPINSYFVPSMLEIHPVFCYYSPFPGTCTLIYTKYVYSEKYQTIFS